MKMLSLVLLVFVSACDLPPPPDNTQTATFPKDPGGVANVGGHLSSGVWLDATVCTGAVLSGYYMSDFGLDPPATLGTIPLACRPAAKSYEAACSHGGNKAVACSVKVSAAGVVTLLAQPWYDLKVTPDLTKPLP